MTHKRILFCNCTYAQIIPKAVKSEVLRGLVDSGVAFDAVADLCEMSARKDPELVQLSKITSDENGDGEDARTELRIAACFPRAVHWLFHAASAPLPSEHVEVLNMRDAKSGEVLEGLLEGFPGGESAAHTDEETA